MTTNSHVSTAICRLLAVMGVTPPRDAGYNSRIRLSVRFNFSGIRMQKEERDCWRFRELTTCFEGPQATAIEALPVLDFMDSRPVAQLVRALP
jgi:hypothetical protein